MVLGKISGVRDFLIAPKGVSAMLTGFGYTVVS
jgi:hypothetical protein